MAIHIQVNVHKIMCAQACNQGGSRGLDETPILTSFLMKQLYVRINIT